MSSYEVHDGLGNTVEERVSFWMPILEASFGKGHSQKRCDAFYTAVAGLSPDAVHRAFVRIIRERKTFPPPAVLREFALEEQDQMKRPIQRELFLVVDNAFSGVDQP